MRTTGVIDLHAGEKHRAADWGRGSTGVAGSTVTCVITQAPSIVRIHMRDAGPLIP